MRYILSQAIFYISVLSSFGIAPGGPLFAQDAALAAPLTLSQVREMIGTLPDAAVKRYINDRKVDFELTPEIESEFKTKQVSQDILDLIRIKRVIPKASIEISCKPVDCEIFFDGNRVGTTTQGRFRKTGEDPLKVIVSVRAAGYTEQSAVLQLVANQTSTYDFTLERTPALPPVPAPAPPPVTSNTTPSGTTPSVNNVAPSRQPDPPKPDITPQQVLNRILDACGGLAALKSLAKFTATGNLTLVTGRGSPFEAQLKESVSYPNGIKWEMRVAGVNWNVTSGPEETWSDGDAKFRGSEAGQELERNIKVFISLHLPAFLNRLQERDVRISLGAPAGEQQALVAQTTDDRWTITIDSSYRPMRIAHEALTGLQPKTEMVYGRYETQGKAVLPMSMTLRNANQPNYGHEVRYLKIDTTAQPKDGDFRRRGFLGILPK